MKEQYSNNTVSENQYDTELGQPVPRQNTKSDTDRSVDALSSRIKMLEDQLGELFHDNAKLHRQISRLRDDISDIVTTLRSRG